MITRVPAQLGACLAWVAGRLARDDRGATAIEYSLIIVLIAAVIAAVVGTLGTQVSSEFSKVVAGF
jgi:pilus assembly protein Flp/PilA